MTSLPSHGAIVRDQRGFVLVAALFALVFLVGTLCFVAGRGDANDHHHQTQSAADAAAYSAAVVHATAMNDIAFLNMGKLGVTVRLTHSSAALTGFVTGYLAAMIVCKVVPTSPACGSAADLLKSVKREAGSLAKALAWGIPLLVALDRAQQDLVEQTPDRARERADHVARGFQGVHGAIATGVELPLETEDPSTWCGRLRPSMRKMLAITIFVPQQTPEDDPGFIDLVKQAFTNPVAWIGGNVLRSVRDTIVAYPVLLRDLASALAGGTGPFHALAYATALLTMEGSCRAIPFRGLRPVDGAWLGSDHYQIQAFVRSDAITTRSSVNLARTAAFGAEPSPGGGIARRRDLGSQIHGAQSEHYLAGGPDPQDKYLWNQRWKARLSVFRRMDDLTDFEAECGRRWPDAPCAEWRGLLDELFEHAHH